MRPFRYASLIALGCVSLARAQHEPVDRAKLETTEELTEQLANRLLKLSVVVRGGNVAAMQPFFAERIEANPMPAQRGPIERTVKWVRQRDWEKTETARLSRDEYLRSWKGFLAAFAHRDDVRIKVKRSTIAADGKSADAELALSMIAQNAAGHREWVRVRGDAGARRGDDGAWVLDRLQWNPLQSLEATDDLFVEVSIPAKVGHTDPPFAEQRGAGYLWRGAAAADVNADGNLDLFVIGQRRNYLYLNSGDGRFEEVADRTLLGNFPEAGVQPLFTDVDNDGDLDLFVSADGPQMLFENRQVPDGKLEFWFTAGAAGVAVPAIGFSAVVGDVNRDGAPDIYVCSYNRYGDVMPDDWAAATNGTRNLLFINKGNGKFDEVGRAWGVADTRWSYAAAFADIDGDHDLDLYVANDYGTNALYLCEGDRFVEAAGARGVLDPGNGMGVAFGDYDNDGDLDLHVTNMSSTAGNRILARLFPDAKREALVFKKLAAGNSLFANDGKGTFTDVTEAAGPFSAGWAWGGGFFDFDNDGWEDLYTPNGFLSGSSMADT